MVQGWVQLEHSSHIVNDNLPKSLLQCCIQQFLGGAGFSTSIAKRKTVVQPGSLGQCSKLSSVGSRGKTLEIFGYFAF